MKGLRVVGTGRCLPKNIVTNAQLSRQVDTSDEWIASRTGVLQRHIATDETNASMAERAAQQALERAGINPEQVGACIVATLTPDYATPSVACLLQRGLELPEDIPCFDLNAACSGFVYGLTVARGLLAQGTKPYALVVGSEIMSRTLDLADRATCVLFGDGAGAVVVEASDSHNFVSVLGTRGDDTSLSCPVGGTLQMQGSEVFRFATDILPRCIHETLNKAGRSLDEVDYVVCHQANQRIIAYVVKKLKAPEEKFYLNVQYYGNTSAASIPIALDEMATKGLLAAGSRVLCVGFGGGLTWGGAWLEW
jgi:3-oxoacyl-[acyl-carrier-protein] synthase-3